MMKGGVMVSQQGGSSEVDLSAPGPIGDGTPDTITGTTIVAAHFQAPSEPLDDEPAYGFVGDAEMGLYKSGDNQMLAVDGGNGTFRFGGFEIEGFGNLDVPGSFIASGGVAAGVVGAGGDLTEVSFYAEPEQISIRAPVALYDPEDVPSNGRVYLKCEKDGTLSLVDAAGFDGREIRIYSDYQSAENWERLSISASHVGDLCVIQQEAAGTGIIRGLVVGNGDGALSFYGAAPVNQAAAIPEPSGGAVVDTEARTAIASIITALTDIGIIGAP